MGYHVEMCPVGTEKWMRVNSSPNKRLEIHVEEGVPDKEYVLRGELSMLLESVSHLKSLKMWLPKTQTVRTQFLFTINKANFTPALHFDIHFFPFFGITGKPTIDLETHDIVVIEEKLSIPVPF